MDVAIVVISQEALETFTQPALDLLTGQLVELSPLPEVEQLELEFE